MPDYCVYIMSNRSSTLYTGVTNDLLRRVREHKEKILKGFTSYYNCNRLVYFEITEDVGSAIWREKQIKGWRRDRKIELIESLNPDWNDLSLELLGEEGNLGDAKRVIKRRARSIE